MFLPIFFKYGIHTWNQKKWVIKNYFDNFTKNWEKKCNILPESNAFLGLGRKIDFNARYHWCLVESASSLVVSGTYFQFRRYHGPGTVLIGCSHPGLPLAIATANKNCWKMPQEGRRFTTVDAIWKECMKNTSEDPLGLIYS